MLALVVVGAVIVGGAGPAFANPPDAPPQPTVAGLDGAILVTFDTPFDGGSAILSYTAVCTSFDGGATGFNVSGTSPIIVFGLTNGSSYTCTVLAHNADGDGPTSPVSDVAIPSGKPAAPPAPTVLPLNASILVSFETAFDGGSPITGYAATCTSSDGGVDGSNTGLSSPIAVVFPGLPSDSNGKTYTCTVKAQNNNGFGPDSQPSASTVPNTVPDTPAAPTASPQSDGTIRVDVVAPFDGGSPITGFTAVCSSPDDGVPRVGSNVVSPISVVDVIVALTYTCTVTAANADGNSGTSEPSAPVTPGAAPGALQQPTVAAGNASISVAFVPPASNGSAITGYAADCKSSNGGIERKVGGDGVLTSPILVTSLTNGRAYTCTVQATNFFGSATSPPSASVVPKTLPGRPGAPSVRAGNTVITVSWNAPNNGGFPIDQYRVLCSSSNGGAARGRFVTTLSVGMSGVTNGKLYTCNVAAHTSVGWGATSASSAAVTPHVPPDGFRVFSGDGGTYTFGQSPYFGSAHVPSTVTAIAMMTTPDNRGYWLVTNNGVVYAFGNAKSYGSLAGRHLNRPIVGAAATRTGRGYWLVASDGGMFSFGDARFHGSTGGMHLNRPIVGMAATWTGGGYWLVASDGGMFTFGDAHFYGSAARNFGGCNPARTLANCVVGMAASAGGNGYWIAAGNGTVIGFGNAGLTRGPVGGLVYPIMGIAATDTGRGYWIVSGNGVVVAMGDAPFIAWSRSIRLSRLIRGISR